MQRRLPPAMTLLACLFGSAPSHGEAAAAGPGLGVDLGPTEAAREVLELLPAAPPASGVKQHPLPARIVVSWSDVEPAAGSPDWSAAERVVEEAVARGLAPVICLTGSHAAYYGPGELPSPLAPSGLDPWLRFVRDAAARLGSRARAFEVWDGPAASGFAPQVYAFVLKASALAVRAEARARGLPVPKVAQGWVRQADLEWQQELWDHDSSPYVDALPVELDPSSPPDAVAPRVVQLFSEAAAHPPAPELWVRFGDGDPNEVLASAAAVLGSPAAVVWLPCPAGAPETERLLRWASGLNELLGGEFAPAPLTPARFLDGRGVQLAGARLLAQLFDAETGRSLVLADLSRSGLPDDSDVWIELDGREVREARFVDPAAGLDVPALTAAREGRPLLRLRVRPEPVAAVFERRLPPGLELPPEELAVETARAPTAEEIIARHQEVQKQQDDALQRWIATGRVDFHFKLAQAGSTVDVSIDSRYLWQRDESLEWEQLAYYINGNRVRWKRFPELPLIQPEKVVTLPLDLTLDRTYVYRLVGEEDVGGRPAYVLAFEPAPGKSEQSLYQGRVWVDRETFVRLRAVVLQTHLGPPVLSNEEVDEYRPVTGPDGRTYWLLSEIRGQQIWTAGGRNFVVLREVRFADYEINPDRDSFEERRRQAYASPHTMLRDTEEGFRYLRRSPDGRRVVQTELDTNQWFAAAGVYKDSSLDSAVPLGGVNYFDYDLFDRKIQFNAFFAGLLAFVNASKPDVLGGRADLALEATAVAFKRNDKVFSGDREVPEQRVRLRSQSASLRFGIRFGEFFKATLIGDAGYEEYFESKAALQALDAFREDPADPRDLRLVLPPNHREYAATVQLEYNRRGYNVTLAGSTARRSRWAAWGLFDNQTGEFVDPEPAFRSFSRWRLSGFKEWYLPRFQKLRAEANLLSGSRLDRFSRYRFSFFGDTRLNGFSGTGVRFDRGAILRAGYAFNLLQAVRFDVSLERAWVEDRRSGEGRRAFTGLGLSGNVVGPWKTVTSFGYGRAIGSDVRDLEGKQEFLVTVLKLF